MISQPPRRTKALPWALLFILAFAAAEVSVAAPVTTVLPAVADTTLRQHQANQNRGLDEQIRVGWAQGSRVLVRFDSAGITATVGTGTLVSAHLELDVVETGESWSTPTQNVDAHRVTAAWTETGATWSCGIDTQPGDNRADCDPLWNGGSFLAAPTASVAQTVGALGRVRFDVTADVAAFLASTPNHGWLLKKANEALSGRIDYAAKENLTPERAPRLVVVVEQGGPDTTPPVITIVTPRAGSFVSGARPSLATDFADPESGVDPASVVFKLDGADLTSEADVTAEKFAWGALVALNEGAHDVEVKAADRAGNVATATWSFTVDLTPPALSIVEPAGPVVTGTPRPTIAVIYGDALSGLDPITLEITVDSTNITALCAVNATAASCTPSPLGHGQHTITALIQDRAGHTQVVVRTFELLIDTAPPTVTIAAPANGAAVNTSAVVVSGTVTDDVEVTSVTVNGQAVSLTDGAFSTEVALTAAVQSITVVALDGIAQQGSASVVVISDQAAPTLTVASPASPARINTEVVHVTGRVDDDDEVAELRVAGEPVELMDGAFAATVPLTLGPNLIFLMAFDRAGNSSQQVLEIEYFNLLRSASSLPRIFRPSRRPRSTSPARWRAR